MISDFLTDRTAVGTSNWGQPKNALPTSPSNPVSDAYDNMFGGDDGGGSGRGSDGSGVSSGVSGGVSGGTSPGSKGSVSYGRASDFNNNIGSIAGKVGSAVGAVTGIGGLGTIGALGGLAVDAYNTNNALANYQTPGLGLGAYASAALNNATFGLVGQNYNAQFDNAIQNQWGPAGFDPMASFDYANFSPFGTFGFNDDLPEGFAGFDNDPWGVTDPYGPSPSWDTDIANAADQFGTSMDDVNGGNQDDSQSGGGRGGGNQGSSATGNGNEDNQNGSDSYGGGGSGDW